MFARRLFSWEQLIRASLSSSPLWWPRWWLISIKLKHLWSTAQGSPSCLGCPQAKSNPPSCIPSQSQGGQQGASHYARPIAHLREGEDVIQNALSCTKLICVSWITSRRNVLTHAMIHLFQGLWGQKQSDGTPLPNLLPIPPFGRDTHKSHLKNVRHPFVLKCNQNMGMNMVPKHAKKGSR